MSSKSTHSTAIDSTTRRSHAAEDRPLARRIGARLRRERLRAGLTQTQLAEGRYTKAYVSALENGLVKPSMAALHFLADRLNVPVARLLADEDLAWLRLEADVRLASGEWQAAADRYAELLEREELPGQRADLLVGLAEALSRLDRGAEAIAPAAEAARLFAQAGRAADAALAMYWQSYGLYQQEASDEAVALLREILRQVREGLAVAGDFEARVVMALAANASRDGHAQQALAYLEEARARIEGLDDRRRATFLFSLALSYRELGDNEAALRNASQSLVLFRAAESELEVASLENHLALVYLALGNLERARASVGSAEASFQALGDRRWLAHTADTRAVIELAGGDAQRARASAEEAVALSRETSNQKALLDALLTRARAERAVGDPAAARSSLEEAATLARFGGRRTQLRDILVEWSDLAEDQGDLKRALELSREALGMSGSRANGEPAMDQTRAGAERAGTRS